MNWKGVFNFLGWALTIILTLVLFFKQDKHPSPVYAIIKSPSLIFDRENSSPKIKVLVEDSIIVRNNVYVTTIAIWNRGNEEIKHESIRTPFYIFCNDTVGDILECKIIQINDTIESNFSVHEIGDSLQLNWDYFDPDYGCKLQVIYTGNDGTSILASGKTGRHIVKKVLYQADDQKSTKYSSIVIIGLSVFLILFSVYMFVSDPNRSKDKLRIMVISICFLGLFILFWFLKNRDAILSISIPF